jgi:CBS domain-containing protein
MNARDIMTPNPFVVAQTDDVCKAAELMRYENIGGVPVVRGHTDPRLVGIITDRDITTRFVARGHHGVCFVRDVMTPLPLHTVSFDADVSDIVRLMEQAEVRRIPVVNADGALVGIVAEADLVAKLSPAEALPLWRRVKQYSAAPHVALHLH